MLSRIVLLLGGLVLTAIGSKYVIHPVAAAAASGLRVADAVGETNVRASFGAFPLACALVIFACAISRRTHGFGLSLLATVIGTALLVRTYGIIADGTFVQSRVVLTAEAVLFTAAIAALVARSLRGARRRGDTPYRDIHSKENPS